jgi:hypothetical protein
MSKANVKSVSKDVAILSLAALVAGAILEVRDSSALYFGRYTLGCVVILVSAWLIYPGSGEDHTLYDGARLRAYILLGAGALILSLGIPESAI